MRSVLLLDGNNTYYRANAVSDLHDSAGNRVSGVYGMIRIIRALIERFKPMDFVVVWDGGRSPARRLLYPEYKKKVIKDVEQEAAEQRRLEFVNQTTELFEHLPLFGLRQIKLPKTEADDVIAMLSIELSNVGLQPIVVSTDNDYLQLLQIDAPILVYSPVKDVLYDRGVFVEQYGFQPDRMLEYKSLIGDGSDNIGGINGIGDKTAKGIINKYQSLDYAYRNHADELQKSKKTAKIIAEYNIILRNMQLMNLLVPCVENLEQLIVDSWQALLQSKIQDFDHGKIQRFLVKHNFASILTDYNNWLSEFGQQIVRSKMGDLSSDVLSQ